MNMIKRLRDWVDEQIVAFRGGTWEDRLWMLADVAFVSIIVYFLVTWNILGLFIFIIGAFIASEIAESISAEDEDDYGG